MSRAGPTAEADGGRPGRCRPGRPELPRPLVGSFAVGPDGPSYELTNLSIVGAASPAQNR